MGLFRKNDELFEIMSRHTGSKPASASTTRAASTGPLKRPAGTWSYPSADVSSGPAPRPLRMPGGKKSEEEFFELDGDALVLVDDGFVEGLGSEPPEAEMKTYTVRHDTAVVGAILMGGLLVAAFMFGRTSTPAAEAGPAGPGEVAVVVRERVPDPAEPAAAGTASSVPASFRPAGASAGAAPASAPAPQQAPQASEPQVVEVARSAPAPQERYMLVVATTTPDNATSLATWLNEQPRSPIFGREGLEAEARGGEVRIRGFAQRDEVVLKRVRETSDPMGSGTFHSAYFRRPR